MEDEITAEVVEKLNAWFREKGIAPHCPLCKHTEWTTFGHFVSAVVVSQRQIPSGQPPLYPMLSMVCRNCYSIQSFSAVALGLAD